ncbi:MAG: HK97 family phage prohead protease [Nitrococcus sp.]|nr:HK97 family phage prohead protease [Nitrococcus sp.]
MPTRRQRLHGPTLTRRADIPPDAIIDESTRLLRVSFSSEEPVTRSSFFSEPWTEILGHATGEVDLTRVNAGAPVLYNHDRFDADKRLGVVERAWIEGGRGHAEIRISKRAEVDGIWQDIQDGVLRNVSVGYRVHERELQKERAAKLPTYRVTRWEPVELSMVDIPADTSVGIGRGADEPQTFHITDIEGSIVTDTKQDSRQPDTREQDFQRRETSRRAEVRGLFEAFQNREGVRAVMEACLDDSSITIEQARKMLLDELGRGVEPVTDPMAQIRPLPRMSAGETRDDFRQAVVDGMLVRYGVSVPDPHPGAVDMRGAGIMDLARTCLSRSGATSRGWSNESMLTRAMTSSDLPSLLADVAHKAAMLGFGAQEVVTHRLWTRPSTLADFKQAYRVALSAAPGLEKVVEGAEYQYGSLSDAKEAIQLATYGKILSITRQALINDDLGELVRLPLALGQAAARKESDIVYALLTANANMRDANPLFDATNHGNDVASGSGAAPSVATLGTAKSAMRRQTGIGGTGYLNITPRYLIVPTALEVTAEQLLSTITPAQAADVVPTWIKSLLLVVEPRLDDDSATAWYLAGDPTVHDTIEVANLDGQQPSVDQEQEFNRDVVAWKVRVDVGAAAIDWRALYRNEGA